MIERSFSSEQESLKDKVILVTGGYQGIGRSISHILTFEKAQVVIIDKQADGQKTAGFFQFDLKNIDRIPDLLNQVVSEYGRIDILVNNAALPLAHPNINELFTVNLLAPWALINELIPIMKKQGGGRVVNISSIIGVLHQVDEINKKAYYTALAQEPPDVDVLASMCSSPDEAYALSKKALIDIVRKLISKTTKDGITINTIAPGFIATEGNQPTINNPSLLSKALRQIPIGRPGNPEEVADLVAYLCKAPQFLTGSTILIDGGQSTFYHDPIEGKGHQLTL